MFRIPAILVSCIFYLTQAAQLPAKEAAIIHTMTSVNPADSSQPDLSWLKERLKDVNVVMLGEPTHGEGNVLQAKTKLVKYLHEQLGFDIIAFESGFYDVHKAQLEIIKGQDFFSSLEKSIFPIWVNSKECRSLWNYLQANRSSMQIAGFDPQITGAYGKNNMREDLEEYLASHGIQDDNMPDLDLFEDVIIYMADNFRFPATIAYADYEKMVNNTTALLKKMKYHDLADAQDGLFWIQCLKSCLALAVDYYKNDPTSKTAETFKAKDSNPRDAQMADNLLFLLKKYPGHKIICWGATTHLMNNPASLDDPELRQFISMGQIVKRQPGIKAYAIGATTSSGQYGIFAEEIKKVDAAPEKSIEHTLETKNINYALIEFSSGMQQPVTCMAIEHKPLSGDWSKVLDAVLYLKEVVPSTFAALNEPAAIKNNGPDTASGNRNKPVVYPTTSSWLIGKVTDRDRNPVSYASVQVSTGSKSTVTNNTGLFKIAADNVKNDSITISSIGYTTYKKRIGEILSPDTVYIVLDRNDHTLTTVTVTAPLKDARKILEKAINRIPTNYLQQDFNANVYMHDMLRNYADTLQDVEYVFDMYCTGGYRPTARFVSALNEINWVRKKDTSYARRFGSILNTANTTFIKSYSRIDMLFGLPLFTTKNISKYSLTLDSITTYHDENVYVISFGAKKTRERYTFSQYCSRFGGQLFINCADFAIVRYDMDWDFDTTEYNKSARRFFSKPVFPNDRYFWSLLLEEQQMKKTVLYEKEGNIYNPKYAAIWHRQKGTSQLSGEAVSYFGISEIYLYDIHTDSLNKLTNADPSRFDLYKFRKPYNKSFWENFDRPYANVYSIF